MSKHARTSSEELAKRSEIPDPDNTAKKARALEDAKRYQSNREAKNKAEIRALGVLPNGPPFPSLTNLVPGSRHEAMIKTFLPLQDKATEAFPSNWFELATLRIRHDVNLRQKNEIIDSMVSAHDMARPVDIDVVTSTHSLRTILQQGLVRPLCIPPDSPLGEELGALQEDMSLDKMVAKMFGGVERSVDVQDLGVEESKPWTKVVTTSEVRDRYLHPEQRGAPWNSLELGDPNEDLRVPELVRSLNILQKLQTKTSESAGRPTLCNGLGLGKRLTSWQIYSERLSFSGFHCDTAGLGTFLYCREGAKKFYFISGETTEDWERWIERQEYDVCGKTARLVYVDLVPGTWIFFQPGCVHMVLTILDTGVAGGHTLFEKTMPQTVRVLGYLEQATRLTNDEQPVDIFTVVANFITRVISGEYLSKDAQGVSDLRRELELYLSSQNGFAQAASRKNLSDHEKHLRRKESFLTAAKKSNWLGKLSQLEKTYALP